MTGLIHSHSPPFDGYSVINMMRSGNRWPRPGYLRKSVDCNLITELRNISGSDALLQALTTDPRSDESVCDAAVDLLKGTGREESYR